MEEQERRPGEAFTAEPVTALGKRWEDLPKAATPIDEADSDLKVWRSKL